MERVRIGGAVCEDLPNRGLYHVRVLICGLQSDGIYASARRRKNSYRDIPKVGVSRHASSPLASPPLRVNSNENYDDDSRLG
jgi:hypothetical protein